MATYEWANPKPRPEGNPPNGEWVKCWKCGGNGLYVMSIENGQPFSATGLTCYACGGKGWRVGKPKPKRNCQKHFKWQIVGIYSEWPRIAALTEDEIPF